MFGFDREDWIIIALKTFGYSGMIIGACILTASLVVALGGSL